HHVKNAPGMVGHLLLRVPSGAPLKLLLVLGSRVGLVLGLGVLAVQCSSPAILLEELGGGLVATDLHRAQLLPLPLCISVSALCQKLRTGQSTYGRGSWIAQTRCGHRGCGGWKSNRGTGRCQRGPTSMSGSSGRSRSRSVRVCRLQVSRCHAPWYATCSVPCWPAST